MSFSTLGLSPVLWTPLARLGYAQPTPVQAASIPVVLSGRDLLARAQTGTGKTAAFGLPMIDRLLVRGGVPAGSDRYSTSSLWLGAHHSQSAATAFSAVTHADSSGDAVSIQR